MKTTHQNRWRAVLPVGGAAAMMLLLAGCGCRNDAALPAPPGPPRVQSPVSPVARAQSPTTPRAPQTPTAPRQAQTPTAPPLPAPAAAPVAPPPAPPVLDIDKLRQVKNGMPESEVFALLGQPGFVLSQSGDNTTVYRWAEQGGPTLIARFEDGKLARKNVLNAQKSPPDEKVKLSEERYASLAPGMTLEEALALLEVEPKSRNTGGDGASIVRWADEHGSSFTARFEDGKLVRKTGFHVAAKPKARAPEQESDTDTDPGGAAPETPQQEAPAQSDEPEAVAAAPAPEVAPSSDEEAAPVKRERVRVAGEKRRNQDDAKDRSYNPKAKLPAFAHGLRTGSFEVQFTNPSEYSIKAGLRAGNRGIDVSVPARGKRSVRVDRGNYSIYFISDRDPFALNGGGTIDLNGMFATDLEISLIDEDYQVRTLDSGR